MREKTKLNTFSWNKEQVFLLDLFYMIFIIIILLKIRNAVLSTRNLPATPYKRKIDSDKKELERQRKIENRTIGFWLKSKLINW